MLSGIDIFTDGTDLLEILQYKSLQYMHVNGPKDYYHKIHYSFKEMWCCTRELIQFLPLVQL